MKVLCGRSAGLQRNDSRMFSRSGHRSYVHKRGTIDSRSHAPRGNAYRLSLGADSSVPTQSAGTSMKVLCGRSAGLQRDDSRMFSRSGHRSYVHKRGTIDSRSHAPRGNTYRLSLGADSSVPTQSAGTSMNHGTGYPGRGPEQYSGNRHRRSVRAASRGCPAARDRGRSPEAELILVPTLRVGTHIAYPLAQTHRFPRRAREPV